MISCVILRVRRRSSEPTSAVKTVPHLKAAASMRALSVTMAICGTARAVSSACVNGVRCCANGSSAPDPSVHGYVSTPYREHISMHSHRQGHTMKYSLKDIIFKLSCWIPYIPPLKHMLTINRAKYTRPV